MRFSLCFYNEVVMGLAAAGSFNNGSLIGFVIRTAS
jgi:hypothetical protein